MNDIDFDELDRAVASALGANSSEVTSPQSSAAAEEPALMEPRTSAPESVSRSDASLSTLRRRAIMRRRDEAAPVSRPAEDSPAPVSEQQTSPPVETAPEGNSPQPDERPAELHTAKKRIIPHRSGRAMDVIASTPAKVSRPVSRVATTVAPSSGAKLTETDAPSPVIADILPVDEDIDRRIAQELETRQVEPTAVAEPEEAPTKSLDDIAPEVAEQEPVPYETELTTFDEAIARELAQTSPHEDVTSPFITDAKVDKRPLGGVDSATAPMAQSQVSLGDTLMQDAITPAELHQEVVAIEAKAVDIPSAEVDTSPVFTQPKPQQSSPAGSTGPASIPRQYKEAPRVASEDDEAGAIFDPHTYDIADELPKRRLFGWGWVIAIVSILLLFGVVAVLAWMEGILPILL